MSAEGHDRWRDETAAYLLGSLEPDETADLERHLEGCPGCRSQLRWLMPAIQVLPETVAQVEPPPTLRSHIMAEVRSDAAEPGRPTPTGPRWLGDRTRRRRIWAFGLRPAIALTVTALIVAVAADYAIRGHLAGGGGGTSAISAGRAPSVTARLVRNGESATLRLTNLYEPPKGRVFQAWVKRGRRVVSANSLFVPNADGTATAVIPNLRDATAVMVTAEPRGGSSHPTSAAVAYLSLRQ